MGLLEKIFPPMSRDGFARKAVRVLAKTGVRYVYDPQKFLLTCDGHGLINLANYYAEYCRLPLFARQRAFEILVQSTSGMLGDDEPLQFERDKGSILPRLRDRAYFDIVPLQLANNATPRNIPHRVASDELAFELVLDAESACMTLMDSHYEELGKSLDELWSIARDNLYRISVGAYRELSPGLYMSPFEDSHDASRLLLPDLLRDMNVRGALVAAPIRPQLVLFCGKDDAESILKIAEISLQEMQSGGRTVTGVIFELRDDAWRPLELDPSHPAYWPVRRNRVVDRAVNYNDQKELLEETHEKEGRDCFVGSVQVFAQKDSPVTWTSAIWGEGISDALMPVTDVITFAFNDKRLVQVLHDDVLNSMGHRLKPEGSALVRYHTTTFPTEAELASLPAIPPDDVAEQIVARARRV